MKQFEIMKKIINIVLGAIFLALFSLSCDVERFPYDRIEQTQAFSTMTDANALANGIYAQLRNRIYGVYMYNTDVQADFFNATREFGNRNGSPHRWDDFMATDYSLRDIWRGYYQALVNVNNIIANIHRVETKTPEDVATIEKILGEAHFARAFYYHQLVIRWGKPYDPATAVTDLGVPLVLTYSPAARPARASVQHVYNQILEDLTQAETRLPVAPGPGHSKITADAVKALKVRVLLHMRNYPAAAQAASELIATGRFPLISNVGQFISMWYNDSGAEVIFRLEASLNELPVVANNIYLGFINTQNKYKPDFVPQMWVVEMFDDVDIRKNVFLPKLPVRMMNIDFPDIHLFHKFPGNPALRSGNVHNYQHKPVVLRIAEVHLNMIEALYMDNKHPEALSALNVLRVARGLSELSGLSGDALFEEIKLERTRELLGEGFRLNDLMRWGMGFQRSTPQNMTMIETGANYEQLAIPAGHPKFIWGIPQNDLTTNPNLVQNPDW
jgi:starch-binding outer membrane protein, SusD/RagB family